MGWKMSTRLAYRQPGLGRVRLRLVEFELARCLSRGLLGLGVYVLSSCGVFLFCFAVVVDHDSTRCALPSYSSVVISARGNYNIYIDDDYNTTI